MAKLKVLKHQKVSAPVIDYKERPTKTLIVKCVGQVRPMFKTERIKQAFEDEKKSFKLGKAVVTPRYVKNTYERSITVYNDYILNHKGKLEPYCSDKKMMESMAQKMGVTKFEGVLYHSDGKVENVKYDSKREVRY